MNNSLEHHPVAPSVKILMLLLALSPILSMYGIMGLSYTVWSFLIAFIAIGILYKRKLGYCLPKGYVLYWIYLSLDYLIITRKTAAVIPGGLTFFVFSLILIFTSKQFDIFYFRKYLRILCLITCVLFLGQELMWYTTGSRFVPLIPLGKLTTTLDYSHMLARNHIADRSSSIFFEPSHFAVYILLGLVVELFATNGKKLFSNYVLFLLFVLLLLRSGTGIVGMAVVLLFRLSSFLKKMSLSRKFFTIVLAATIGTGAIWGYSRTTAGAEIVGRSGELSLDEEGHSYTRFVVGWLVYLDQPTINKIIGSSDETLLPAAMRYSQVTSNEVANILYMNGWQHVLAHTGLIGFVLFLVLIVLLYKNNNALSKCSVWLFVVLSLFEQTYCQPIMMVVFIIATYYQKQSKSVIYA